MQAALHRPELRRDSLLRFRTATRQGRSPLCGRGRRHADAAEDTHEGQHQHDLPEGVEGYVHQGPVQRARGVEDESDEVEDEVLRELREKLVDVRRLRRLRDLLLRVLPLCVSRRQPAALHLLVFVELVLQVLAVEVEGEEEAADMKHEPALPKKEANCRHRRLWSEDKGAVLVILGALVELVLAVRREARRHPHEQLHDQPAHPLSQRLHVVLVDFAVGNIEVDPVPFGEDRLVRPNEEGDSNHEEHGPELVRAEEEVVRVQTPQTEKQREEESVLEHVALEDHGAANRRVQVLLDGATRARDGLLAKAPSEQPSAKQAARP
mmetsp:Transcript_10014/g.21122  ORF Transcript_10014/g.21122 Transcript_10014/m.21122 type:complete len:323 (+) Transcript_10014:355-1323(+)